MKKRTIESHYVPVSSARRWAAKRNFTIFRLRGSYVSIPPDLLDKKLEKLSWQINFLRQEMISHIETSHATYEESKETRRKDSLEKGLKNA